MQPSSVIILFILVCHQTDRKTTPPVSQLVLMFEKFFSFKYLTHFLTELSVTINAASLTFNHVTFFMTKKPTGN